MAVPVRALDDPIAPEPYLALERESPERHEYAAGSMYAMSGTTAGHGRIIRNLMTSLDQQLAGRRCEAFSSELKVQIRIGADEFFYYPDVVVDCGSPSNDSLFAKEPRVIFEVLSPSTARADRHEKRLNCQRLDSLEAYVLVDPIRVAVTVYRRGAGEWAMETLHTYGDVLRLPMIDCSLSLGAIYQRMGFNR